MDELILEPTLILILELELELELELAKLDFIVSISLNKFPSVSKMSLYHDSFLNLEEEREEEEEEEREEEEEKKRKIEKKNSAGLAPRRVFSSSAREASLLFS